MRARTFTESGRRAQIVRAAIAVIAEAGYLKASFSRIAKHAGLSSTGMISYHFAGKDDLLKACVTEIEEITGAFMQPRIDAAVGHVAQLRAYVEANVELVGEHPAEVKALIDLVKNAGSQSDAVNGRLALFEEHFRTGQAAGVFGSFDPRTAAVSFTAGLDAVVATAAAAGTGPAELTRIGRELADLYVRATAPESAGGST
ncbi:TetR/AcrR family transcriptional regulator [Amycolatopsis australiensis]|uniref:DNA-binding transcriptional regulator, AcrR family n=1 Tax=Amycolatopsis australiensis TaxID=546364 RepID=A0A1K1T3N9_9PSEU|nr:TetR/AcrR family transcriptional regulator [Amycolatopsis australiensis]SFW91194.1 DNA-binding transcriptional regulator, AcrR family [Amycolatopsis australiensis]